MDKLPNYLRGDKRDVNHSPFLDNGHYMLSNVHYGKIIQYRKWGRPVHGAFPSAEESCVMNIYIYIYYCPYEYLIRVFLLVGC